MRETAMCFTFVFAVLVAIVYAEDVINDADDVINDVAEELHVQKEDLVECMVKEGVTAEQLEYYTSFQSLQERAANCFQACIMQKSGQMVDGKIVTQKVQQDVYRDTNFDEGSKPILYAAIALCAAKVEDISNECEVFEHFGYCLVENLTPVQ